MPDRELIEPNPGDKRYLGASRKWMTWAATGSQ